MKNYIKYIIWSLSLVCFSTSYAQRLSWGEQRNFRLGIYNAIENYEKFGSIYNEDYKVGFVSLFESENLDIYNDLLGVSTAPSLTVNEYIKNLEDKTDVVDVSIRNINIGELYMDNGRWQADVTFDKEMKYFNKSGLPISSKSYYGVSYNMSATFAIDNDNEVRIVALNGEIQSDKLPLPDEYFAVKRSTIKGKDGNQVPNPRDLDVLCNGNKLDFMDVSEVSYAFVPTTFNNAKFVYSRDNDIKIKPMVDGRNKDMYYLRYRPTHWRLKVRSDFAIGDYYKFEFDEITGINKDNIEVKSVSNEYALELGYVFPSSKKLKVGLFLGGGIALNKFEMGADSWVYNSKTTGSADIDGDGYTRCYSLNGIKQELSTKDVVLPVYFDFEYRFSKWFSMYLDLGAKAYYNIDYKVESFSANYSVYGIYEKYDNLKLDYKSGINGFTKDGILDHDNISQDLLKPEEFSFDAFGSIGFRVGITKNLQLGCGATYQMGLTEYFKNTDSNVGMNTKPENVLVMYSASQDKENVRSMAEMATSVKRQSLKINVGLTLKF